MTEMSIVGNTPMIKIRYRLDGIENDVYTKLEYYNPSGSIKDRIADFIVREALAMKDLIPGQPIVEVTSGNTGIAFSALGAREHFPVHIFMPDWASEERKTIMRMYGATLHEVSKEEGGFLGALEQAEKLAREIDAYMPHQFDNPDNTLAHFYGTGVEIVSQLPEVDGFVSGVGSGGTLMGISRRIRLARKGADVKILALEPAESPILSGGQVLGPHKIEGIGDDFIPSIYTPKVVSDIYDISSDDAVNMASRIAKELGLGVGISSGANFIGAVHLNETCGGKRHTATVFSDDNKKYLTTSLSSPVDPGRDALSSRVELLGYETVGERGDV